MRWSSSFWSSGCFGGCCARIAENILGASPSWDLFGQRDVFERGNLTTPFSQAEIGIWRWGTFETNPMNALAIAHSQIHCCREQRLSGHSSGRR